MQPAGSSLLLQPAGNLQGAAGASVLNNPGAKISTPAPAGNGVYWVGADGNVYLKGAGGNGASVTNLGLSGNVKQSQLGGAYEIKDPNPPAQNTNNNGYGGGGSTTTTGGGTASTYQDKSNDIAIQNAGLAGIPGEENTAVGAVQDALSKIMAEYTDADTAGATEYDTNKTTNENDLQSNKQTALEDAVSGRQGLYSTLASLGALSGSGLVLANNAVQKGANTDLTTAANTYAGNENNLDNSYEAFKKSEQTAEAGAEQAGQNDEEIAKNNALKDEQGYLKNLVADYQDEGNTAQGNNYTAQLVALQPQLDATNVPQLSIGYTGGAYTAPTLSSYVGSANNTTVQTTPGTTNGQFTIPGLVAAPKKQQTAVS